MVRPQASIDGAADTFSRRIPLIVAAAFFMETLDSTIIAIALPAIAQSLGEPTLKLTASITVYLIAMAGFVPTAGWASDRFGARNLFAVAVAALALGLFQTLWAGGGLALSDFQNALFSAAGLMAVAVLWSLRLPPDAGAELSRRS